MAKMGMQRVTHRIASSASVDLEDDLLGGEGEGGGGLASFVPLPPLMP